MPSTSQDGETKESPKKLEGEESGAVEDNQSNETPKNGSVPEDKPKKEGEDSQNDSENSREKIITEANTLLAQGKRHLFVKDYPSAVTALGDACSKLSEVYGEFADECAEAYFNYGVGLLEFAREERGVLEDDNKHKESDQSEDGEDETEDNEAEVEGKDTVSDKTENVSDDKSAEEKPESEDKEKGEEEEEDEDVNNLQLAWEMFELAKIIFIRQNDEKKLADTYLKLGEVALESENYDSAITDIQSCLDLQKKTLPPVSREIAETLFQFGVACSLCNQFDEGIKHFTAAGVILEKRIQILGKMTEPEPEKAKNPFYTINNEIEEIKALLPLIKDKIADMEEFRNETLKAVIQATIGNTCKETVDGAGPSTNGTSTSSASSAATPKPPVNDISHLVRKKRKNPENDNDSEPKKQCNSSNSS